MCNATLRIDVINTDCIDFSGKKPRLNLIPSLYEKATYSNIRFKNEHKCSRQDSFAYLNFKTELKSVYSNNTFIATRNISTNVRGEYLRKYGIAAGSDIPSVKKCKERFR